MHFSRVMNRTTPKALNQPAQRGGGGESGRPVDGRESCEARATLGFCSPNGPTLKGLKHCLSTVSGATLSGLALCGGSPRVDAPASHQPWAGRWNAVGVLWEPTKVHNRLKRCCTCCMGDAVDCRRGTSLRAFCRPVNPLATDAGYSRNYHGRAPSPAVSDPPWKRTLSW